MTEGRRRIRYAGSVHDEREIAAVVEVLRDGPTGLRIGRRTRQFEERVASLMGKRRGVMCNSGSSALYLAIELLGLEPGDEVITPALTFSTDIAAILRSGAVPVFVDVEPDTFNMDVGAVEDMVGPRTRAILAPNLIGNAPDWDRLRDLADVHRLQLVEDSCDALGLTLGGRPTGARADISVTSFALSHIITAAGTGGMICLDDAEMLDRCLVLRRWGRRSEVQLFGSRRDSGDRFFSDLDGMEYDDLFIFDEVGWNFEPSEVSAAFGLVQLDKLDENLARRKRNFQILFEHLGMRPDLFVRPRTLTGLDTAWHMFPFLVQEDGLRRSALQQWMESRGVDTRMVWSGNATRQPAFRNRPHRVPNGGLPNADAVMARGLVLPCNHGLEDEDMAYICETLDQFVEQTGEMAS
ncbi:MAG: DegT/DnrJ/EryC1/StrS family aminotransferase [Acidimicrobiales bacterium]|nr:DegT/DnrJ/EryC1/StrS family aminotransferase [Acidimicrobiales bacterium]